MVASLNHKELGKSQVPTLEVGDVIEADLWKSKLGGGAVRWQKGFFLLSEATVDNHYFDKGQAGRWYAEASTLVCGAYLDGGKVIRHVLREYSTRRHASC